jgi:hypothetical protein
MLGFAPIWTDHREPKRIGVLGREHHGLIDLLQRKLFQIEQAWIDQPRADHTHHLDNSFAWVWSELSMALPCVHPAMNHPEPVEQFELALQPDGCRTSGNSAGCNPRCTIAESQQDWNLWTTHHRVCVRVSIMAASMEQIDSIDVPSTVREIDIGVRKIAGATRLYGTRLFIGMSLTLLVSLSIHVVMLQVLGIPFPEFGGVKSWAAFLNTTLAVLSVGIFYDFARPRLARFSKPIIYLVVFLLYVMLKETFRGMLMNGVVTGDWLYDIIAGLPSLISGFVLTSLVVLIMPRLSTKRMKLVGAPAIAALMMFGIKPLLGIVFASALKTAAPLDHADLYSFPYGWHVLVPAYISYAEPVIACTLVGALIWQCLSTNTAVRFSQFILLVLLMRGMLLPTLIYSFYSKMPVASAMLSQSQFLFETIALAALTGLTWQHATNQRQ